MNTSDRPRLETPRLLLRPFRADDAETVVELAGDRDIAGTTRLIPHPYERPMADAWIASLPAAFERGELTNFAVVLRSDDRLIGSIGLTINQVDRHAELGYWIGKPFWNHGYATEAAAVVLQYAFETLQLHRVYAHHMAKNPASGRVMQKVGLKREGVMKEHRFKWGKYEDLVVSGATEADYRAAMKKRGTT